MWVSTTLNLLEFTGDDSFYHNPFEIRYPDGSRKEYHRLTCEVAAWIAQRIQAARQAAKTGRVAAADLAEVEMAAESVWAWCKANLDDQEIDRLTAGAGPGPGPAVKLTRMPAMVDRSLIVDEPMV